MDIAASRLSDYLLAFTLKALGPLPSSGYTVKIIDQAGKDWRSKATAEEVLTLAAEGKVIGKGTKAKLKHVILTVPSDEAQNTLNKEKPKEFRDKVPSAEANQTVQRVNDATGQYYRHRNHICATYPQFATAGRAD